MGADRVLSATVLRWGGLGKPAAHDRFVSCKSYTAKVFDLEDDSVQAIKWIKCLHVTFTAINTIAFQSCFVLAWSFSILTPSERPIAEAINGKIVLVRLGIAGVRAVSIWRIKGARLVVHGGKWQCQRNQGHAGDNDVFRFRHGSASICLLNTYIDLLRGLYSKV